MGKIITRVVLDEESGHLAFEIPEELFTKLQLHDGELLEWELSGKEITIRKTHIIDSKKKEEQ